MMIIYGKFSDEQVVEMARGGDENAADFLLRKYQNMVMMLARRFYIAGADQDDISQMGMIGLYRAVMKYSSEKNKFSTFAYQCIKRAIIDALKSSLAKKNSALNNCKPISEMEETLINNNTPEQIILREEQTEMMWKKVKEILSLKEYQIFQLYIEGLAMAEIAETAGISYKSCDNALQRIRKKIRNNPI